MYSHWSHYDVHFHLSFKILTKISILQEGHVDIIISQYQTPISLIDWHGMFTYENKRFHIRVIYLMKHMIFIFIYICSGILQFHNLPRVSIKRNGLLLFHYLHFNLNEFFVSVLTMLPKTIITIYDYYMWRSRKHYETIKCLNLLL